MSNVETLRRFVERHAPHREAVPSVVTWRTGHDVYGEATGFGVCWPDRNGDRCLMLCDIGPLHGVEVRAEQCAYIVDDGSTVLPYRVTRWCLHEGSTSCEPWIPGGYLSLRRQHPRPVDAAHMPRRTWHLIIRETGGQGL